MPYTSFNHEEEEEPHVASLDYPELAEILEKRPPPENQYKTAEKQVHDARCSLCNMNPATRDIGGTTVCESCAENQFGIPIGQEPSQFGQPKFAKGFPETQKCKYCKNPVTKRLIWAEGMAYIPVCDSHVDQARDDIVNKNNDEVIATKEAGFITDWLTGRSGNPKSEPGAENAWSYDWCKYRKNSHCMLPKDLDQKKTKETGNPLWIPYDRGLCSRMKWIDQASCPVSEPSVNAKRGSLEVEGNLDEIDISTEASIDKTASYWDVQQKAKRLRNSGDVKLMATPQEGLPYIYAYVQGDNGDYYVVIEKDGYKIKGWLCTCLLPTAPITMYNGSEKEIQNIFPGDIVMSKDRLPHMVTKAWSKNFVGQLVKFKVAGDCQEIIATDDHQFWAYKDNEYKWVEAKDLIIGDYLTKTISLEEIPLLVEVPNYKERPAKNKSRFKGVSQNKNGTWRFIYRLGNRKSKAIRKTFETFEEARDASLTYFANKFAPLSIKVDEKLSTWLGWYAAEGCLCKNTFEVSITLNANEMHVVELLDSISMEYIGIKGRVTSLVEKGVNVLDYRISHPFLYGLAKECVGFNTIDKSNRKLLSEGLMHMPLEEQRAFMQAWQDGDGHVDLNRQAISSANYPLISQAQEILNRLGFKASINKTTDKNKGGLSSTQNAGPMYMVRWTPKSNYTHIKLDGNTIGYKIKNIEYELYEGEVWDIEVKDEHSFKAYGVNVHNCRWGDFGPDGPDAAMREENSPYKNRKCSHVLAAAYELQSRNMKNAKLEPFVVQSPNGEKHTIIHVDNDILITDMGQILDGNVIHPNYDSKSGL